MDQDQKPSEIELEMLNTVLIRLNDLSKFRRLTVEINIKGYHNYTMRDIYDTIVLVATDLKIEEEKISLINPSIVSYRYGETKEDKCCGCC